EPPRTAAHTNKSATFSGRSPSLPTRPTLLKHLRRGLTDNRQSEPLPDIGLVDHEGPETDRDHPDHRTERLEGSEIAQQDLDHEEPGEREGRLDSVKTHEAAPLLRSEEEDPREKPEYVAARARHVCVQPGARLL